jgi:hypothetical protein
MSFTLRLLFGALTTFNLLSAHAQGPAMDKSSLITRQPFDVKIVANGRDVTSTSPLALVKYNADGTGTRTLKNGQIVSGSWRFINPQQTQIEVNGPEGSTRWVLIELTETVYRKANMDTGVEFIHLPRTQ